MKYRDELIYTFSNFLLTLMRMDLIDDIESEMPKFYRIKKMWEKDYDKQ